LSTIEDPIIKKIKMLYELGDGGKYEIIQRTIFIIENALKMGKNGKFCIDRMMDKGVRPLELGIALSVAITRVSPAYLNGIDSSIRAKILNEHSDLLEDFKRLEEQNE